MVHCRDSVRDVVLCKSQNSSTATIPQYCSYELFSCSQPTQDETVSAYHRGMNQLWLRYSGFKSPRSASYVENARQYQYSHIRQFLGVYDIVKQSEESKQAHSDDSLQAIKALQSQLQSLTESFALGIESLSTQSIHTSIRELQFKLFKKKQKTCCRLFAETKPIRRSSPRLYDAQCEKKTRNWKSE